MLDRLTLRVHILEANGESFRLKDCQQRGSQLVELILQLRTTSTGAN